MDFLPQLVLTAGYKKYIILGLTKDSVFPILSPEAYSEPSRTSKVEVFAKK